MQQQDAAVVDHGGGWWGPQQAGVAAGGEGHRHNAFGPRMDALGIRVFVVCGRAAEVEVLQEAFQPYGLVQNVKLIKEKGVAYVTYDRASSAALAIEQLNGAVLNGGRGPKLKVMLAEAPTARGMQMHHAPDPAELSTDPDNMPPRSRLFLVVPKLADTQQIQAHMSKYPGLEYCKVDLVATKGVVFCKFYRASAALAALEDINASGMVAGYKVKCMLAEPKTKRKPEGAFQDVFGGHMQQGKLDYGMGGPGPAGPIGGGLPPSMGVAGYGMGGLPGLPGGLGFPLAGGSGGKLSEPLQGLGGQQVGLGFVGGLGSLQGGSDASGTGAGGSASGASGAPLSKQRLYVVVHKGVSEDMLARLFKRLPGMEYCDLKKDYATGKSKGFCYVNYSTPEAAAAAIEQYNGMEFPPHSGHRIKVLYAEPLGVRPPAGGAAVGGAGSAAVVGPPAPPAPPGSVGSAGGACATSPVAMATPPSVAHAPLSRNISPDIVSMTDSLGSMAMPSASLEPVDRTVLLASPVSSTGGGLSNLTQVSPVPARKLMFP